MVVPSGWFDYKGGGRFTIKYPNPTNEPSPVLGLSVWDVGQVFRDPCHWQGQAVAPGQAWQASWPRSSPSRRATQHARPT